VIGRVTLHLGKKSFLEIRKEIGRPARQPLTSKSEIKKRTMQKNRSKKVESYLALAMRKTAA
jgi:hypothetical protein